MSSLDPGGLNRTSVNRLALVLVLCGGVLSGCRSGLYEVIEPLGAAGAESADLGPADLPRQCGMYSIRTRDTVRADLLLVQDKSRSMTQGIHGEREPLPGQSKWELVREAIKQTVGATSAVDWGLLLFGIDNSCSVPNHPEVPVGAGTADSIRRVLDQTVANASTPTALAINSAVAYFRKLGNGHPHYILLATDGQPSCAGGIPSGGDDSVAAIQAVTLAADAGVATFVVGIGSSMGAETTLGAMARAGRVANDAPGQPSYYPVTSAQDLAQVLERAALHITPCTYPLPAYPPVPDRVTIFGARGIIPRDVEHRVGWDYSADGRRIVFYGPACEQLSTGVETSVQAIYECPGDGP